jgi:Helix-turn-helix domain
MIKKFSKGTKTHQLFKHLQTGAPITANEAASLFGIKNVRAEVTRIRQHGFAVYSKSYVAGNHVKVTYYVMGTPSQEIVALGYKAKAMGITI